MALFSKFKNIGDNAELMKLLDDDGAVTKLARELIKDLAKNPTAKGRWEGRTPDEGRIKSGVRKLLSGGLIDAAELAAAIASGNPIGIVKEGIEMFQVLANSTHPDEIPTDGIVGPDTLRAMKDFRGCNPRAGRGKKLKKGSFAKRRYALDDGNISVVYCHIDPAVVARFDPTLGKDRTVTLIGDAWDAWLEYIPLSVKYKDKRKDANVVIEVGYVDGPQGDNLADADVAGPVFLKQRQCSLKIDKDERFNESRFLWMMTHELGHILGMEHYAEDGILMGVWLDESVKGPTTRDTDILKGIWI